MEVTLRLGSVQRQVLTTPLAPPALGDSQGRRIVRPWDLNHDDYVAHAFDQLRQAAPSQPHVVAALLRVLRMLIAHVEAAGYPERAPALRRQMQLLLHAARTTPGLHPADLERLQALTSHETDPADHSRQT